MVTHDVTAMTLREVDRRTDTMVTMCPRTHDLFMRLIHTCRLNRINPFACLLAIATHATEVKSRPSAWLPWNYPLSENPAELDHDPPGLPA